MQKLIKKDEDKNPQCANILKSEVFLLFRASKNIDKNGFYSQENSGTSEHLFSLPMLPLDSTTL